MTYERSYDSYHKGAGQIYRLTSDLIVDGEVKTRDAMSFNPSGQLLTDSFEEIEAFTLTFDNGTLNVRKGESLITEKSVKMADEHFVQFFGYEVLAGDPATMLAEPYSIVLTESKAAFYFGKENPIGKTLKVHSGFDREFKVTGVLKDTPSNTHFKFEVLVSIATIQDRLTSEAWRAFNYYTYLRLKNGSNIESLEQQFIPVKETHLGENSKLFFNLQPIQDIHLLSEMTYEPETPGSASSINFLEVISIFILLIAWVNYINLSTAKAVDRAKEVGLRKVIGAQKNQIRIQFLLESFLINLLGGLMALFIAELSVPYFNNLIGQEALTHLVFKQDFLIKLISFTLIGTLISGFYPSIFLSNFGIVKVLKGKFKTSKNGVILRKTLVVGQFAASLILIAGTFTVIKQVDYLRSADVGMNIDQVMGLRNPNLPGDDYESQRATMRSFLNSLLANPLVKQVAATNSIPGGHSNDISSTSGQSRIVGLSEPQDATTYIHSVDESYFDLLEVQFLHGRNFQKDMATDTAGVILNEAFVKRAGLPVGEELIGQKLMFGSDPENTKYPIIGIIKNANRGSLKHQVEPTGYFYEPTLSRTLVKLSGNSVSEGVEHVEEVWTEFFPNSALEYSFLDDRFNDLYANDQKFGAVFGAFSGFALLVAILGLFGLSSFMASQRTKEVGVRKVLGASIAHIVSLFYKEFLILIGLAAIIGTPVVFYSMDQWLASYAYRISFPWLFVILSLVLIIICAFLTVGYQVWRVAILNPSKTLKYE